VVDSLCVASAAVARFCVVEHGRALFGIASLGSSELRRTYVLR